MKEKKLILGCAVGNCVHIGGLNHFLQLAEIEGFKTVSLGPAVPLERLYKEIKKYNPDIIAVSYRLTPEVSEKIFNELHKKIDKDEFLKSKKFIFGGTPKV